MSIIPFARSLGAIFNERKPIAGLDGLRALCVTLVLIFHAAPLNDDFDVGGLGVYFFFSLSGFLVVPILYRQRLKIDHGMSDGLSEARIFLLRRILRIVPAYYTALLLLVIPILLVMEMLALPDAGRLWLLVPSLFAYTTNFSIAYTLKDWPGYLSHFWSLAVEQQFYLSFPLLFIGLPARYWVPGMAALLGVLILSAWLLYPSQLDFYVGTLTGFVAIIAGGLLALTDVRIARSMPPLLLFALSSGLYLLLVQLGYYRLGIVAGACLFPLVLKAIANQPGDGFVRLLEWPALRGIGVVSYGFYIYHNLMLLPAKLITRTVFGLHAESADDLSRMGYYLSVFAIAYALTMIAAIASYQWIEMPFLRLKDGRRPAPVVAAARVQGPADDGTNSPGG